MAAVRGLISKGPAIGAERGVSMGSSLEVMITGRPFGEWAAPLVMPLVIY